MPNDIIPMSSADKSNQESNAPITVMPDLMQEIAPVEGN